MTFSFQLAENDIGPYAKIENWKSNKRYEQQLFFFKNNRIYH